jgi:hypothetical protein
VRQPLEELGIVPNHRGRPRPVVRKEVAQNTHGEPDFAVAEYRLAVVTVCSND